MSDSFFVNTADLGPEEEIVPPGIYDAVTETVDPKQGEKGPYLLVKTRIIGGEYDGNPVYGRLFFTDKTRRRTVQTLEMLQGEPVDRDPQYDLVANSERFENRPLRIQVKQEEFNGSIQARVDRWLPPVVAQHSNPAGKRGSSHTGNKPASLFE